MVLLLHGCKDTKPSLKATCASKPPEASELQQLECFRAQEPESQCASTIALFLLESTMETMCWAGRASNGSSPGIWELRGGDPLPILHKGEKSSLFWCLWDFRAYLLLSRASLSWWIQLPDHYVPAGCWVLRVDGIVNHSPPLRKQPMAQSYWALLKVTVFWANGQVELAT